MNANQDKNTKGERISTPIRIHNFLFLKMCLHNDCNLNEFYRVFVLNFNAFGEEISFIMKDAGALMSRCSGPSWLILQFVAREKLYKLVLFHADFFAGKAVKMSLHEWQGVENGHFYRFCAEYLVFERRFGPNQFHIRNQREKLHRIRYFSKESEKLRFSSKNL